MYKNVFILIVLPKTHNKIIYLILLVNNFYAMKVANNKINLVFNNKLNDHHMERATKDSIKYYK